MKLKTAALLGVIGSGISVIIQIINFVKYHIIDLGGFYDIEMILMSLAYMLSNILILIFLIVFYNKQNNKSWKD